MARFLEQGLVYHYLESGAYKALLAQVSGLTVIPAQPVSGLMARTSNEVVTYIMPLDAVRQGVMIFIVDAQQYNRMLMRYEGQGYNTYILHRGQTVVRQAAPGLPDALVEEALAAGSVPGTRLAYGGETYILVCVAGAGGFGYGRIDRLAAGCMAVHYHLVRCVPVHDRFLFVYQF
jgi:hypothetical protein